MQFLIVNVSNKECLVGFGQFGLWSIAIQSISGDK